MRSWFICYFFQWIAGEDKELRPEVHLTESTESGTDLTVVLNAWYSAGFYTGK